MKKAIGQTVRDLKREVNKKVLKVPGIEQKVLDATSNEPWGPHGSLLADIAQATRNYHEYQMIMAVIWKRINDTGKNWRHVYKALTVLEYLVAHGSERVIDEIREHSYQISTLSDFQYIDSSGRDQGSNVRKKSQSLVVLVNDKERIFEVRQKAAANRDKFRSSAPGGMYRPSSYSSAGGYGDKYDYDRYDGRYGSRDEDQNGYGKEREYGYKDDDRSSRYGDSNSRDGDRYGRDYEERYGRDGYKDDDYRGRSRSVDNYQYGSRSRSSDRGRAFDDDGQSSSRGSGARANDHSQDGRPLERKFSEQNIGAPPNYEDAVSESRSPVYSERDGETSAVSAPVASSPSASNNQSQTTAGFVSSASPAHQEVHFFDEFDPRGPFSAGPPTIASPSATPTGAAPSDTPTAMTTTFAPTTSNSAEMDLLGSLSDSFSSNPLAIMPATSVTTEADAHANSGLASTFSTTQSTTQSFEDPFGDTPFKAIPSMDTDAAQQQNAAAPFQPTMNQNAEMFQPAAPKADTADNFGFGDSFSAISYSAPSVPNVQPPSTNSQFLPQELSTPPAQETDILADILPPSGPTEAVSSQPSFSPSTALPTQTNANMFRSFNPQSPFGQAAPASGGAHLSQGSSTIPVTSYMASQPQNLSGPTQLNSGNFVPQGSAAPANTQILQHNPAGTPTQHNSGNFLPQQGSAAPVTSQISQHTPTGPAAHISMASQPAIPSSAGPLAIVPQPSKDKFEPKSAVWADTLSRGLVNFNISGPKTNPLADIGVDFDAINRKEKRMEKPSATPVTSTVTMGKAMGSGSGLGRSGSGALRPASNPMMGAGMGMSMGMGMGGGPGAGMAMGGGGGPGVGMGMSGGLGAGMGMGGGLGAGMGMSGGLGAGMGMGSGPGMGMGGYGGMNQPMGMGMGMNTGMNMGMGMNPGMRQGVQMQPQNGMAPGSAMPGSYNPMMGSGGYAPQQPYGGGYR